MNQLIRLIGSSMLVLCLAVLSSLPALAHPHILRATDRTEIAPADLMADLAAARVVFIGELHDNIGHHRAQLAIIRALSRDSARPLAIGLEMFRRDSQAALDRWTAGGYAMHAFLKVYDDNWSMWEAYREIFVYARDAKVRMVGLNIPRAISSKVARNGFAALPEGDRQALGNVQCRVDPEYGNFIRRAMGGHGGHGRQYLFFCEAQMLWDTMMARHIAEFLKENPTHRLVVLAGSGHAWKFGIPRQLLDQMDITYRVVLPEIDGRVTRSEVDPTVTDYLWLNEGLDGWTF